MYVTVDYENLRRQRPFKCSVSAAVSALWPLAAVAIGEYNLKPQACIEVYRKGRPLLREMFGPDVPSPAVSTPHISYGHVNALGSELLFPQDGEVGHTHFCKSLEEALAAVKREVDFASAGMAPFYLDFRRKLQQAFPDEPVAFSFGLEGPITTAYELRGDGIFYDVLDRPDLTREFLRLLTDSINAFHRFRCKVQGNPPINPRAGGMCDDVASMIPPRLWPDLVLPFWDQFYRGQTTGHRSAHVEDLRPRQLGFLEEIGLSSYDPSISPKLNPQIIARSCRVPFVWRLGGFHCREMTCRDVEDFVFQAAADGASGVKTVVEAIMVDEATVPKVHAFARAGKQAEEMLAAGASREELAQRVSPAGRRKFWDHWPQ